MKIPSNWKPATFANLIGPAAQVGRIVDAKIKRIKAEKPGAFKVMFYGPPGSGKTSLAQITAEALAGSELAIERISGLTVNVDLVKRWMNSVGCGGLFGDWQVKLVNEMDRIPSAAQDLLLEYLDVMPAGTGFIGTSNLQLDLLQERFQTRMQTWKILGASTEDIVALITKNWPEIPPATAGMIAVGSGGNVRAALLDTESQLDAQLAVAA